MAIFTSLEFGEIRGSLGGKVYSRNRFGQYVRNRAVPVNPQSARQTEIRSIFANLSLRWRQELNQTQRDQWDVYGDNVLVKNKLGLDIKLTGYNHYLRSNSIMQLNGLSIVDDGPAIFDKPGEDALFGVTGSESSQLISVSYDETLAWRLDNSASLSVFMGEPQNSARLYFGGPWRHMGFVEGNSASPASSPQVFAAPFPMQQGQKVTCYARIERSDARLSDKFQSAFSTAV